MYKIIFSLLILTTSASAALAFDCSKLPRQGPVALKLALVDGTTAVFRANLVVEKIVTGFREHKTTHTYNRPQVFVADKEVGLSEGGLNDIAQRLGYEFAGFRDVQTNAGYFRKRQVLTSNGKSFVVEKAPRASNIVAPKGSVLFFQSDCADWAFN